MFDFRMPIAHTCHNSGLSGTDIFYTGPAHLIGNLNCEDIQGPVWEDVLRNFNFSSPAWLKVEGSRYTSPLMGRTCEELLVLAVAPLSFFSSPFSAYFKHLNACST